MHAREAYLAYSQRVLHGYTTVYYSRVLSRRSNYRSNRAQRTSDHANNNIPAHWPAWFSRQKSLSVKDMDTHTRTHTAHNPLSSCVCDR